jgi:hypothetical protein
MAVGRFAGNASVNLSSHVYTVHPYYALTAFAWKRIETSWRVHYLWSSENTEPPRTFGARSIQPGQAYHFNATLSYQIAKHVWLGANGYFLKQITDPEINGIALEDSREQVGAIGPGAAWNHSHWFLNMNGYRELGAKNRPTGNKMCSGLRRFSDPDECSNASRRCLPITKKMEFSTWQGHRDGAM